MKNHSFLESLAAKCHDEYGRNADQLTVVFPNRRAGLFFRKYLGKLTDKPIWSPRVISLEEFILSKSELTPADHLQLLFILYATYKEVQKEAEDFDKFFFWGEMILKDFNEIDSYLVNPEHIFTVIQSQKELDESFYFLPEEDQKVIKSFWSGFLPKASKTQSNFLSTWRILNALYVKFDEVLRSKGLAYKGMIYKQVATDIANVKSENSDMWFAGFNALTSSEEKIIKHFIKERQAKMIWDVDSYYLKDDYQEAGYFFRQYQNDPVFRNTFPKEIPNKITGKDKKVVVNSVSLGEGQVKAVGVEISKICSEEEFKEENTVVVLPDENLLLPLLNSLPDSLKKVNVTMGYPLKNSGYFTFFEALLDLHANVRQKKDGSRYYYFKNLLSLLNHEVCKMYFLENTERLVGYIHEHNRVYLSEAELQTDESMFYTLFKGAGSVGDLMLYFQDLIEFFQEKPVSALDRTILMNLNLSFKNISKSSIEFGVRLEPDVFRRIYRQLGTSIKVPFSGEPLEGIQVMGVLETRNLDFDNVFILSMNEGVFPSDSSSSSFIPFNIRKAFDLPVMEHHDSLQSYLFYRLLQSANRVNIYYNNISEYNHNGELSRLVKQLEFESGLSIENKALSNPIKARAIKPVVIHKDGRVLEVLNTYLVNGASKQNRLSPSALNTYLDCRLKFYFQYVERIKEPVEVTDDLDPALFGNLLHTSMEYLYKPYVEDGKSRVIEKEEFSGLQKLISAAIGFAFDEHKMSDTRNPQNGRAIIAERVIKRYIEAILKYDEACAPFEIVALEAGSGEGYVLDLPVDVNGRTIQVALKGIIDRIDRKGNAIRILDYKSGRDERKFTKLESLFDRDSTSRNKAVMQIFYYCLLYKARHPDEQLILTPGLFNSRDLFSSDFDVKIKYGRAFLEDFSEVEEEYTELLKNFVGEMFDQEVPFDQTSDTKKCNYCPYVGMCMRN
ncbi:MAG: PD-(D/E)XK nuclease family protein [Cyclobacteriaceae bacterium]